LTACKRMTLDGLADSSVAPALSRPLQAGQASVFMGVPPMYSMLVAAYDSLPPQQQSRARAAARGLRLTVCGSSACPVPLMTRWHQVTGQYLLERWVDG
jgi:malonyl-CoA/methylmalonyl-CoA synthetase